MHAWTAKSLQFGQPFFTLVESPIPSEQECLLVEIQPIIPAWFLALTVIDTAFTEHECQDLQINKHGI